MVDEVKNKSGINNVGSYIRGAINNLITHILFRNGTRKYQKTMSQLFFDWLNDGGYETV
ncbi:hypothetical protein [Bacillus wiedmannii]|uniref:hypothetical protein n=1 Tax=Bacillus wiedmannii TaxID=1890302 RepID=UPI003F8FFCB7